MVQGEQLDLTCKVTGYPFPMVEWRKDGQEFNTSKRIHFSDYEGSPTGKLTIFSLEFEDKGTYSCIASSTRFENTTATAEWVIRVKGKITPFNFQFLRGIAQHARTIEMASSCLVDMSNQQFSVIIVYQILLKMVLWNM